MKGLHEFQQDFAHAGRQFRIIGLEDHRMLSSHPLSARKKRPRPNAVPETVRSV